MNIERELDKLITKEIPRNKGVVFLSDPLTSTNWDGDAYSSTPKTLINLNSVFGVPINAKAVLVQLLGRDSGSLASTTIFFGVAPNNVEGNFALGVVPRGLPNDTLVYATSAVPCDNDGNIYYQIDASGTNTFDCWIRIWGWWL